MSFPLPSDAAVDETEAVSQQLQQQPPLLLLPAPSDSSSTAASSSSSSPLIDALPYIDVEYNEPHMKAAVHALITAELQLSAASVSSFLSQLPDLPALRPLPSLQPGYVSPASLLSPLTSQHLAASFPSPPAAVNASSASGAVPSPPSSPSSLSRGVSYLLEDGLQHQLLRQYGPQQSALISQHLRARKAEVQAEVDSLRQRVEAVNRERKRRQDEVRERLSFSERDWWRLLNSAQTISQTIAHSGRIT